jgi:hypothetical protein
MPLLHSKKQSTNSKPCLEYVTDSTAIANFIPFMALGKEVPIHWSFGPLLPVNFFDCHVAACHNATVVLHPQQPDFDVPLHDWLH